MDSYFKFIIILINVLRLYLDDLVRNSPNLHGRKGDLSILQKYNSTGPIPTKVIETFLPSIVTPSFIR